MNVKLNDIITIVGDSLYTYKVVEANGDRYFVVTKLNISDYALNVANDIQRFKIPVYEETRKTLNIELPDGYILGGDLWEWSEKNAKTKG